jgi:starvation-inducible DNA-binding protein
MKSNIGIPEKDIEEIVTFLNTLLADEYALYTKTRNAHWNVKGANFFELHKFFEAQYTELDVMIDNIAERVRSLGHFALGSLKDFLSVTHMGEENHDFSDPKQIIQTLANDHETIIRIIRNDITPIADKYKDLGTADFVTGIMQKHEKMAWMLQTHLW